MQVERQFLECDDTLRYPYIPLRKKGADLLAIQFVHRGKRWKADTPEEAIRLRQQLEAEDMDKVGPSDRWIDGRGW